MDTYEAKIQLAFRALADPSRRAMVHLLLERPMSIAELCHSFDMTRTAVRKHLRMLEEGRVVTLRLQGRERLITVDQAGLDAVREWLAVLPAQSMPRVVAG